MWESLKRTAGYRNELYAARRVAVSRGGGLNSALSKLRTILDREGIFNEVKARRFMTTPCEQRNMIKFARRQGEFKKRIAGHIQRIMEIEESMK
jgi:ribosomal protein S21